MEDRAPRTLIVVAAPVEARAVVAAFPEGTGYVPKREWVTMRLDDRFSLVVTGIGKTNAGAAVARCLERGRYWAVVNLGIGGALPGSGLAIRDVVVGEASVYADEGVQTESKFLTCDDVGFPLGPFEHGAVPGDPELVSRFASAGMKVGRIATVSTCSGTSALAAMVAARARAGVEGMEGAAVGHVALRFSDVFPQRATRFVEVRVVSNTTGDRSSQVWDIPGAAREVTRAMERIRGLLGRSGRE